MAKAEKAGDLDRPSPGDNASWARYRQGVLRIYKDMLSASSKEVPDEDVKLDRSTAIFPRVCAHCYSRQDLTDCTGCHMVAHCPEHEAEVSAKHKEVCEAFKIYLQTQQLLTQTQVSG